MENAIPVLISSRRGKKSRQKSLYSHRNLSRVNVIGQGPSKSKQIPQCLVLNARSIVKPDAYPALYAELKSNNIDVCCISETWLNPTITISLICPPEFCIIRKDRLGARGGGVAILCRKDWRMQKIPNMNNPFECLWVKITTENSSFNVAAVYHPPDHTYNADDLIEFLMDSCEQLLSKNPNTKIIITGDINRLNIRDLLNQLSLSFAQLVKSSTRGNNILDVFVTNAPHYWREIKVKKSLVRTDHNMIIAYSRNIIKAKRTNSFFRDVREHRKLNMLKELENVDWSKITEYDQAPDEMIKQLYESLWPRFENNFPPIKVRTSSRDPPFMSPLVKHLLKKRKKAVGVRDEESTFRLQNQINTLIRANQLNAVQNENQNHKTGTKKWWNNVNNITGRKEKNSSPVSSLIDPNVINAYFQTINTDPNYSAPQLLEIPEGTRIPFLSIDIVYNFLRKQKRSSSGPDDLPYWFWKTYAAELAPAITKIFNVSLKVGKVPEVWKRANIVPIPKENVINSSSELRPISLTDIIMKLFERCIYKNEIADVIYYSIDSDQYAYKVGHNSTMALIKCQHTWLKGLDNGAKYVRVLSFDFSKAFDSVPHDILFEKVKKLPFNPYIINWMIDFLKHRKQRVTVDGITTEFFKINRGVPQGTVLGPILFSIMVNDIKPVNPINELCKFADDITVEASGYDEEDTGAEEVENMKLWSNENRMVLNMNKTYEMIVRGRTSIPLPSCIPSIKRKTWLKILGITLEEIPENWDRHFEEMLKKASGRMYILRVCKYYGFTTKQLELLFQSLIMSLFTFGIELWGGASYTKYISQIDKFVNRAYRNGHVTEKSNFREIINKRDKRLWKKY